jgi:CHAT domain-containing protein
VISSYTPTLSVLGHARQGLATRPRESLSFLCAAAHKSPGMSSLASVRKEISEVAQLARSRTASVTELGAVSAATTAEVSEAMAQADIVHLACHGVQHKLDPLESGFCLGDGRLTVSQLMEIKLDRAFLAFLSARETAKGDRFQPDQTVHLAAAMMFCGFRSVIATMWCVASSYHSPRSADIA